MKNPLKQNAIIAFGGIGLLVLGGCATRPTAVDFAKEQAKVQEIRAEQAEQERKQAQERMELQMKEVPEWALKTPSPDGQGVYAVGIAQSSQIQVAMKKAQLEAEFGLAKMMNQEISGSERSYLEDTGEELLTSRYTALIDKLVEKVPVVGIEVVAQEVKPIQGKYNAFVLLKLPYDEFNQVIRRQRAISSDKSMQAQFDDLERRLDKRRQQRLEETALKQSQDAAALQQRKELLDDKGTDGRQSATTGTVPVPAGNQ